MSDPAIHAVAGGLGGITAMTLTYPLINISTRLAVERNASNTAVWRNIYKRVKEDGILSFFVGLESSLLAISITNVLFYLFYEQGKRLLLLSQNRSLPPASQLSLKLSTAQSIFASMAAGTLTTVLVNPVWIINTHQATYEAPTPQEASSESSSSSSSGKGTAQKQSSSKRLSFLATLRRILQTEGISGLLKGLKPALILVLNPVLQYTLFEQLRNRLVARRKALAPTLTKGLSDLDFFLLGAVSKLFATGVTYPYVLLRSRQHVSKAEGHIQNPSIFDALVQIVQREGLRGLYKGAEFKLTQSVLTSAILFASKERIYHLTKALLKAA